MSSETTNTPDAPYRGGTTGKYNLLIKKVVPHYVNYEYALIDADGKEYKVRTPKYYAENQILCCMVYFKVVSDMLVVADVQVCRKQTLISPTPKSLKPKLLSEECEQTHNAAKEQLGDPVKSRTSGTYRLRVVEVEQRERKNSYWLLDAKGRIYKAESKKYYDVGSIVPCYVYVIIIKDGVEVLVSSIGKDKKPKRKRYKDPLRHWHADSNHHTKSFAPCAGDQFHLIYTPMGNKR